MRRVKNSGIAGGTGVSPVVDGFCQFTTNNFGRTAYADRYDTNKQSQYNDKKTSVLKKQGRGANKLLKDTVAVIQYITGTPRKRGFSLRGVC